MEIILSFGCYIEPMQELCCVFPLPEPVPVNHPVGIPVCGRFVWCSAHANRNICNKSILE